MRLAIIGLITIAAAMAVDVQLSSAQESFFNERFCTRSIGGTEDAGPVDCSFHTWKQCIASAQPGRYCTTNTWWHAPREKPTIQVKSSRRKR